MNTEKMIALLGEVKEKAAEVAASGKCISVMQNATPSIASLRRALSAKYGKRNYKITSSGEVVAFGERPNAGRDGWHHIGYVSDTLLYFRLDMLSID